MWVVPGGYKPLVSARLRRGISALAPLGALFAAAGCAAVQGLGGAPLGSGKPTGLAASAIPAPVPGRQTPEPSGTRTPAPEGSPAGTPTGSPAQTAASTATPPGQGQATPTPTFQPVPAGIWFGAEPEPGAPRFLRIVASPSAEIEPGQVVDLEASAHDAAGKKVETAWAWDQSGSGIEGPWSEASSYRGHLWNLGGSRAQWVADWGNSRAGEVLVTTRAANGATASIALRIKNVPPVAVAASASPLLPGSAASASVKVAADTKVVFALRYFDGNGVTEPTTMATNRWVFRFAGITSFTVPESGSIDWNLDPETRSYGFTTWSQPLTFGASQSGTLTFSVRDGNSYILEHTWQVEVP